MWLLLAAVGCVLTLAAINIASLLLVRSTVRSREWALRLALGATRWDVARLLMVESLLISFAGAAAGIFVGWIGIEATRSWLPANLPRIEGVAADARTVLATTVAATVLGLLAGSASVWHASRGVRATLSQGGRSLTASRGLVGLRALFLIAEVALAVVLVVAGGMFLMSFARVTNVDLGVDVENVLVAGIRPGAQGLHKGPAADGLARLNEIQQRVRALPGVTSVALITDNMPFSGSSTSRPVRIPALEAAGRTYPGGARIARVSHEYFGALKLRLVRGRVLEASDIQGATPVAVISERAAEEFFPGRDPLGQIVETGGPLRVVGVVANVRDHGPELDAAVSGELIYVPLAQSPSAGTEMLVRISPGAPNIAEPVVDAIRATYPELALRPPSLLGDNVRRYSQDRAFNMVVIGVFAILGIAVACVGVHGVSAYIVTQRTKEIGIRRAFGGGAAAVVWAVLRATSVQIGVGIALGVVAALYLSALAGEFLFQVETRDPWLYAGAAAALSISALIATASPVRRAASVDPASVLKLD